MSMLRVCLEYAYSMPRVCLGYTYTYRTGGQTPCAIARHIITSHTCFSRGNTPFLLKKHSVSLGETLRSSVYLSCKQILLTLLLLIGVNGVWADDVPFTPTTDTSAPHYYLLQNVGTSSFYAMPYDAITVDEVRITTTNVPNSDMRFYFVSVENEEGYYYIIHWSGKYLYAKGSANDNGGARLKESSTLPTDDRYKFCIEKNGGGYYIKNKYIENNTASDKLPVPLCKRGGNTGIANKDKNDNYYFLKWNTYRPIDDFFRWNFIPVSDTNPIAWTAPFTPSTEDNYHYYKIKNSVDKNKSFYISGNTSTNKVNTSSTAEIDDITWIFKEVPADENGSDKYITYYYIINAFTGEYMCFAGDPSKYDQNQDDAVILQAKNETNEQKCQFIVTRSSQGNVTYYNIIPKALKDYYWGKQCIGQKDNTDGTNVCTATDRGGDPNLARWVFEQVTDYPAPCADPVISCDADGVVSMTCTEDGAAIHYTIADGLTAPNDPTEADALSTTFINPITSTKTIKAIAIRGPHVSNVVTQTIVYVPNQTFESSTYDGTDKTPVVKVGETTISSDEYTITYEKAGVAVTEHKDAGTYTVTITDKTDGDYIVYGSGTMTISPKALSITAKPKTITYGDEPANDGVEYDSFADNEDASSVLGGTLAYTYNYSQYGDVGSYTITPSGLTATNYNIIFYPGTLTVNQKEVGLTWSNYAGLVYNGSAQKPTCELTGIVNDDDVSVSVAGEQTNAGTGYEATASLTGEKVGNYKLPTPATKTFDIAKKTVTVTSGITANNKEYDGTTTATLVCSSAKIDGKLEGDELTVAAATGTFADKNVGEGKIVTITGFTMGGTSGGNYKAADTGNQTSTTANITQRVATLTWGTAAFTYNATAQAPTATVSNAAEGDNVTVTVTGAQTNVGENYTATAIALSDANYKLPAEGLTCTFTISSATLTVEAMPQTKVYGDADPALTYSVSGFQGSESAIVMTGALARAEGNDVGDYNITQGTLGAPNYTISFTGATFTITKATLAITADDKTKIYGAADPELTYTVTGLKYEDTKLVLSGALARVTGEQVGVYAINQGSLTSGNNYAISYTGANLTITKTGLTITANNNSITYGEAPAGSGVTYSGFVEGDDENKLDVSTLDYDYSYTQFGDVGNDYTIMPKGLTSTNYDITFVAGTLTVVPKEVGLTWGATTFGYDGSAHAPTATATDFVNSDVIAVTVIGAQTNAGSYTATASALTGNKAGNYKLPEANKKAFTITPKSIGTGTLASGYTFDFGENNTILLTDKDIGSALVLDTDYSVSADSDNSPQYSQRTVTGKGNYTGSFDVRNVVISFTTDIDQEEWSATFAAENSDVFNIGIGLALPEGVSAFIISGIQGDWAIPEPLNYIPKGVPVLLVAHKEINGFVPTIAESGNVTPITDPQQGKNMLEVVTTDTPGYDAVTQSAPFATKQIYVLFKNEFVFNKAGDMPKGKVYLNPNHTAPSSSANPAPARLKIAWNYTTGIKDGRWTVDDGRSERWYTLDGRCLSGKPTTKGLYIVNGKKVVIK